MPGIYLAAEDQLSIAVAEKLLLSIDPAFEIEQPFPLRGNQELKRRMAAFNNIARSTLPVLVLTDLDAHPCPSALVQAWRGKERFSPNLLFRIAVRETEAWLLADRESFSAYTGIPIDKITQTPEDESDPKGELLRLIRRHCKNRELKAALLPTPGAAAKVGLGYNDALCRYVRGHWSPQSAAALAPSLVRAQRRIGELASRLRQA
ncbi:protein of unknown function [Methylomagnum ishizawai]|uniref:DUF4276 family protein n=1 Tax=Methylomagnum ishizawai TaxID=1760988 RepID=A0A1Y6D3E6_9GAMM|nr:DUF4276 family protein [Methylomagnum ishizawai]SMF95363.1 protein of unknown function [Methylomagnum ishizawai]